MRDREILQNPKAVRPQHAVNAQAMRPWGFLQSANVRYKRLGKPQMTRTQECALREGMLTKRAKIQNYPFPVSQNYLDRPLP